VEDIPLLADHFLKRIQDERGGFARRLSPELHQALTKRAWPGNVRELQNVVETLAVLADGETIQVDSLPGVTSRPLDLPGMERAHSVGFKQAVDEFEKKILVEAIRRAEGVKRRAAASLGLDPSQMKYLVRKHGL
jgi:DNA-binding NtrC family response regulator